MIQLHIQSWIFLCFYQFYIFQNVFHSISDKLLLIALRQLHFIKAITAEFYSKEFTEEINASTAHNSVILLGILQQELAHYGSTAKDNKINTHLKLSVLVDWCNAYIYIIGCSYFLGFTEEHSFNVKHTTHKRHLTCLVAAIWEKIKVLNYWTFVR